MSSTRSTTASVLESFPNDWHVIVEICRENEDFRELRDHYSECATLLTRLRSEADPDSRRVAEYEGLTKELEQEIRKTIDAHSRRSAQNVQQSDANTNKGEK